MKRPQKLRLKGQVSPMKIEDEIFARKKVLMEKLEVFGFTKTNDLWTYSVDFLDGDFRAEINVSPDGTVDGKVIDLAAGEEYLPVRYEDRIGAFVGTVRLAYADILTKIAETCCEDELFVHPQTNRITSLIYEKYGEKPDFPFSTAPTYGVFRFPKNRKWYALVMDIPKKLVTKDPDANEIVDVINIKIDEADHDEIVARPGFYNAYHMNKKSWVSAILDDTAPDSCLMELIDKSRRFAVGSKGVRKAVAAK